MLIVDFSIMKQLQIYLAIIQVHYEQI